MKVTLSRSGFIKFGKASLSLFAVSALVYLVVQLNLFSIVSATLDTTQTGGENTKTFVNTSIAPDKWTANGTSEWYNFTVTLSSGNATEVVITVPSSAVTTTANFSVSNVTNAPYTNASGTWIVTYPENYSANGLPRMINFSVAPASAFNQSARFDIYATANISDVADSLVNMWNITVRDNETLTYNMTYLNVTADTRSPVFNTTTPGNNSYISGNASQLFQVYVYDLNMNTNNVSLNWKLSTSDPGPANWTTGTKIPCYAQASPLFICNTTIDNLLSFGVDGTSFYFYFQGSDNATNYGNNGTSTVPLTTTIDQSAPTNTSTSREKVASGSKYDTTDAANNFGFEMVWTDATSGVSQVLFESNFTGAGTVKANTTATNSSSTYYVNFSQHNFKQAGSYAYRWYASDSVTPTTDANWAVTSSFTYTIAQADNPATLYLNDTANANVGDLRYPAKVNATGVVTAGEMFLYRNRSGAWTDVSVAENNTNMTLPVGTHAYIANTSGNANYSTNATGATYYATIGKGIVTLNLRLNTTTQANYSIVYPASVNATGNKSATTGSEYNISLYRNGAIVSTSTSANKAEESIQLANGTYNYTVVFNGSVNYTDASVTAERFVLVSKGPTTLALLLNGTAANMTVASGAYVNATVTVNHITEGNTTHNITLYRNGVLYNSSISLTAIENMSAYADVPTTPFTITGSYPEAQNYSVASGTYYVIIESTAPTYADNYTNVTASVWGKYQGMIGVNAAWNDSYNVSRTWLRSNETGTWALTNGSFVEGPENVSNFTINPSSVDVSSGNAVVFGSIYANDTSNNINSTLNYTWTIDGVTPALSSPSPSNQSHVYTNSSYPFRMVVTDYTLNVSNATVRWKKSIAIPWYSGSMTCSGTAPTFTCLKSDVDLSGYGEGDSIYYYFQASDNSSLLGSIGSASNPYVVTLDSSAPMYSNNGTNRTVIGKYDAVKIFSNWTDADTLDTFLVEFTVGGDKWNVTEAKFSSTWSNYSYPGNSTGNWVPGTSIGWRIFANDSVPNWNVTAMVNFTIDNTKPYPRVWDSNVTNASTVFKGAGINVSAEWVDNTKLDKWWIYYNDSDTTGINRSYTSFTAINNSNSSFIINTSNFTVGATFNVSFYANDTSGNENVTELWWFTIDGTKPTLAGGFNIESNFTNASTIGKDAMISVSANWTDNIALSHYWVWYNYTGSVAGTNATAAAFAATNRSNSTAIVNASSVNAGDTFQIKFYANDTSNNTNVTGLLTFTIDSTKPYPRLMASNVTNGSMVFKGAGINVSAEWVDNTKLDKWWVYYNDTGLAVNRSYATFAATNNSNSSFIVNTSNFTVGATFNVSFYANDTSGNENRTELWWFTVDGTAPIITVTFPATNGTYNKSDSSAGKYIWINGTVSDNLQMGMANVSINGTYFNDTPTTAKPYNFTGGNDTAFAYRNMSAIPDGYYVFVINYTDNATNVGNALVNFTVDNTPPSAAYGLTNSSNGTYQSSATQNVQVRVNDVRQTNETTILNYTKWDTDALRWAWTTATMTGTPNTSTVYTGTIDTRCGQYNASGYTLQYYIIGVDNATNTITSTVAGSSSSPLSTITINEYCGNSGNTLGYCSDQALLLSGNFRSITWTKEQLTNCTSLNSDYNISTVLSSINGKYNFVYYKNITASGVSWVAYDPSLAWGLNTLRFANNTNDDYYIYVNASAAVLRIV